MAYNWLLLTFINFYKEKSHESDEKPPTVSASP